MKLSNRKFLIEKIRPNIHGYYKTVVYTGSLRNKPKGYRVLKEILG